MRCDNVNECDIVLSIGETALEINVQNGDRLVVVVLTEGVEKDVLGVV